jgi:hypothetical protein
MINTILKGSPADRAGLKIGNFYNLKEGQYGLPAGAAVQFTVDDGTAVPRFDATGLDGDDGWAYISLSNIDIPAVKKEPKFKVGDMVRVVLPIGCRFQKGEIFTITHTLTRDGDERVYVNHPSDPTNTGSGYNETRFELYKKVAPVVEQKDTTVSLDKIGNLVTVTITGVMSKDRVQSLLNLVFDN